MRASRLRWLPLCIALALGGGAASAVAQMAWVSPDARVRADLQLLADLHLARAPLGSWPMPAAELVRILDSIAPAASQDAAAQRALQRLQAVREHLRRQGWQSELRLAAGDPARLRGAIDTVRDSAELELTETFAASRWSGALALQGVAEPADGKTLRLDGSHLTTRIGNWLLSANELERSWGPSTESSLILSNNARPMPALSIDRASAVSPASSLLRWIGPWRLSAFIAQMDNARKDVRRPLFLGLRVSAQPLPGLDLGLSRTIQLCGEGRRCSPRIFWFAITGKDNVGEGGNVSAADQPGNQMAGWDARLASPWRALPLAYYVQLIGEDQKNYRPTSRLAQHGLESWWSWQSGAALRAYFEYVDTVCGANSPEPFFHCAYTNGVFNQDGYRYRGRVIGHTADADSLLRVAALRFTEANGRSWGIRYRTGTLNRDGGFDPNNSVSTGASAYQSFDVSLHTQAFTGDLELQLGQERQTPRGGQADSGRFGLVSWRHTFD